MYICFALTCIAFHSSIKVLSFHGVLLILVFQSSGHHWLWLLNKHFTYRVIWLQVIDLYIISFLFFSFFFTFSWKTMLDAFMYSLTWLSLLPLYLQITSEQKVLSWENNWSIYSVYLLFLIGPHSLFMTFSAVLYLPSAWCALAYTFILQTKPCFVSHSSCILI